MRKLIEDIIQYQTGNILVDLFYICGLFVIPIIITQFELERTQSSESVLSMYFKKQGGNSRLLVSEITRIYFE